MNNITSRASAMLLAFVLALSVSVGLPPIAHAQDIDVAPLVGAGAPAISITGQGFDEYWIGGDYTNAPETTKDTLYYTVNVTGIAYGVATFCATVVWNSTPSTSDRVYYLDRNNLKCFSSGSTINVPTDSVSDYMGGVPTIKVALCVQSMAEPNKRNTLAVSGEYTPTGGKTNDLSASFLAENITNNSATIKADVNLGSISASNISSINMCGFGNHIYSSEAYKMPLPGGLGFGSPCGGHFDGTETTQSDSYSGNIITVKTPGSVFSGMYDSDAYNIDKRQDFGIGEKETNSSNFNSISTTLTKLIPGTTYGVSEFCTDNQDDWSRWINNRIFCKNFWSAFFLDAVANMSDGAEIAFGGSGLNYNQISFTTLTTPDITSDDLVDGNRNDVNGDQDGFRSGELYRVYLGDNLYNECKEQVTLTSGNGPCLWYGYVFSDPVLTKGADDLKILPVMSENGRYYVDVIIPQNIVGDDHKIALYDQNGNFYGWTPISAKTQTDTAVSKIPVYRAAKLQGGYFYTSNLEEYKSAVNFNMRLESGPNGENPAFYATDANTPSAFPIYRSAKLDGSGYFYTISADEHAITPANNMRQEGTDFYVMPANSNLYGEIPMYRGAHMPSHGNGNQGYIYTSNPDEYNNALPANGYRAEGEVFRVFGAR